MNAFGSELTFWFAVGFVFLVLEMATPGVVFVFFGAGAWLVMGLLFLVDFSPVLQFSIFIVASVAFILIFRKHLKAVLYKTRAQRKVDSLSERMVANNYLGREVEVVSDINPGNPGLIELNGTNWTAKCDVALTVGQRARIVEVSGLVVMVEKL
ncbi:MAG: NfeD family protein [Deltaproteobacteria bacterium]|jgi:membrane protein implicated in regulation of membrane protease activity|nr:NfeD family protein [Deltaproteobacteria bacterium]